MAVPLLLLLLLSLRKPVFTPRFLLICLPAVVLLAGRGAYLLRPSRWSTVIPALLVVLLAALLPGYYKRPKEDWRAATRYVLSAAQPGDAVLVWYPEPFQYYRHRFPEAVPIREFDSRGEPMRTGTPIETFAASCPHVWMVGYDWWAGNPDFRSIAAALGNSYRTRQESSFTGGIRVVRYGQ